MTLLSFKLLSVTALAFLRGRWPLELLPLSFVSAQITSGRIRNPPLSSLSTQRLRLLAAFIRGWKLALIIVACMPVLMLVSITISLMTKKLQVTLLKLLAVRWSSLAV